MRRFRTARSSRHARRTIRSPSSRGTGVAHKLAQALLGPGHPQLARQLDLVALATIADVVPLVDENRALAAAGLRALARTTRPGLRALMRSARVDPAAVDATAVGFRLAPRINAAGRMGRPDVALDLILCDDQREADQLARRLEELNRERQAVEERILRDAVATVEAWPAERQAHRAYVVWGEEWHEGVIGIVASRLVERFSRPVVLVARSRDGWKGSGRSIGSFDLHAGLAACAAHLERYGGHRAAAGLSIRHEQLEPFAAAFAAHADGRARRGRARAGHARRRGRPGDRPHARARAGARAARAVRPRESRADAAHGGRRAGRRRDGGGGQAPPLPRAPARARRRERRSRSGSGPSSSGSVAKGGTTSRSGSRRTTGTGRSLPQLVVRRVFDAPEGYEELRERLGGALAGRRERLVAGGAGGLRRARPRGRGGGQAAARVADVSRAARCGGREPAARGLTHGARARVSDA